MLPHPYPLHILFYFFCFYVIFSTTKIFFCNVISHHPNSYLIPKNPSLPLSPLLHNSQMYSEVDDIEECMLDAQNDTLLNADFSTAEDGTKTFRF